MLISVVILLDGEQQPSGRKPIADVICIYLVLRNTLKVVHSFECLTFFLNIFLTFDHVDVRTDIASLQSVTQGLVRRGTF